MPEFPHYPGEVTHDGRVVWVTSAVHDCDFNPCPLGPGIPVPAAVKARVDAVLARVKAHLGLEL